jgi:hypothetical protein
MFKGVLKIPGLLHHSCKVQTLNPALIHSSLGAKSLANFTLVVESLRIITAALFLRGRFIESKSWSFAAGRSPARLFDSR